LTLVSNWPPETGVCDARLAFCAARPFLLKRAKPWWLSLFRLAEVYGGPNNARSGLEPDARGRVAQPGLTVDEIRSDRFRAYAFACDRVADRLDAAERERLRATGELPKWFLPAVETTAREIKRQLNASR
jgi:hypothetical protein